MACYKVKCAKDFYNYRGAKCFEKDKIYYLVERVSDIIAFDADGTRIPGSYYYSPRIWESLDAVHRVIVEKYKFSIDKLIIANY